jgi:hypothetical protein
MTEDNVHHLPARDVPDPLHGPFEEFRVVVDGRHIRGLTGRHIGDETEIVVDHRFSTTVPRDRAYDVCWLIAQAMAVASGYPHLAADSKDQPFAPQVAYIGVEPTP